jgi:hypothetical protein
MLTHQRLLKHLKQKNKIKYMLRPRNQSINKNHGS